MSWVEQIGGLKGVIERSENNLKALSAWVAASDWADFLASDESTRSCTSICLKIKAGWFTALDAEKQAAAAKKIVSLLDGEGVAFDIGAYRDAPPGLRIWGGATVETSDIEALCPWLDWAYAETQSEFAG